MIDALHPANGTHITEEQNTSTTTLRKPKILHDFHHWHRLENFKSYTIRAGTHKTQLIPQPDLDLLASQGLCSMDFASSTTNIFESPCSVMQHIFIITSILNKTTLRVRPSPMREKATDNLQLLNIFNYNTLLIIDYLYLFDNFIGM